jgi:hypothetical protein
VTEDRRAAFFHYTLTKTFFLSAALLLAIFLGVHLDRLIDLSGPVSDIAVSKSMCLTEPWWQ